MKKTYKVAEHLFCLEMADDSVLWAKMGNYEPFEAEGTSGIQDAAVFSLTVTDDHEPLFDEQQARHVLTDSSDEDMPRIELYEQQGGFLFRVAPLRDAEVCCEFIVDSFFLNARLTLLPGADRLGRFPVDNALMLMYAFSTACMRTLEMHASVVVKDGRGVLFLGRSGTGKSTHSRQWLKRFSDALLLNDDNPIVRLTDDTCTVYGSPWSGKTPCYINASAPVAGFVLLRQATHNICNPLSMPEAYAAIYSSTSGLRCKRDMADGLHEAVAALVTTVPCFIMECLPDTAAAEVCHETLTTAKT